MTELRRYETAGEVASAAAAALIGVLGEVYAAGRPAHVVVLGGSVAETFFQHLARELAPHPELIAITHWWWGDDRFVERGSLLRNAQVFLASLAGPLAIPEALIHELPPADAGLTLAQAADAAELELSDVAGDFDVVMLGMGPDGHVASLFPSRDSAHGRSVIPVTASPKPPPERLSMTPSRLNRTRHLWLLVTGEGKADALRAVLAHRPGQEATIPAQLLDGDRLTIFAERSVWGPVGS